MYIYIYIDILYTFTLHVEGYQQTFRLQNGMVLNHQPLHAASPSNTDVPQDDSPGVLLPPQTSLHDLHGALAAVPPDGSTSGNAVAVPEGPFRLPIWN